MLGPQRTKIPKNDFRVKVPKVSYAEPQEHLESANPDHNHYQITGHFMYASEPFFSLQIPRFLFVEISVKGFGHENLCRINTCTWVELIH